MRDLCGTFAGAFAGHFAGATPALCGHLCGRLRGRRRHPPLPHGRAPPAVWGCRRAPERQLLLLAKAMLGKRNRAPRALSDATSAGAQHAARGRCGAPPRGHDVPKQAIQQAKALRRTPAGLKDMGGEKPHPRALVPVTFEWPGWRWQSPPVAANAVGRPPLSKDGRQLPIGAKSAREICENTESASPRNTKP